MLVLAQAMETDRQWIGTAVVVVSAIVAYWLAGLAGRRYINRMTLKGPDRRARAET